MDNGATAELLRSLCECIGVSGFEDEVRELIRGRVCQLVDEVRTDALGNLICMRKAADAAAPTVMLDAHLDEIGLVVSHIDKHGFLRFATVGGWDERVLPAQPVMVVARDGHRVPGALGVPPPHILRDDARNPYKAEDLFIDIGASSREEVAALGVGMGDSAVPWQPFTMLANNTVMAKALDDRAGCAVLIRVLEVLARDERLPVNVAAVFSAFEEVGARGAKVAAFEVAPRAALVLEGTTAGDYPNVPEQRCPCVQGRGAVITIMDRVCHCAPKVVRLLEDLATADGIPFQFKTPIFGGTDAARIQMERSGVLTGIVSVPCRYIHSPTSTLRLDDLEACIGLAVAFAKNCYRLWS